MAYYRKLSNVVEKLQNTVLRFTFEVSQGLRQISIYCYAMRDPFSASKMCFACPACARLEATRCGVY
jgi:hypothetical protein